MDSVTPPWRAFDAAPSEEGSDTPGAASPAGAARTLPGPAVVGGILIALVGFVAALALAVSGTGGSVAVAGADGIVESAPVESSPADRPLLVVDVAGAVAHPGVYRLASGSRLADAIAAAGGYSPRVAVDVAGRTLNLAAVVQDGQLIVVPSRDEAVASAGGGSSSGGGTSGSGPGGSIELNSATAEQLDTLPGIGPVTAAKIIAARAESPFRSVDDLLTRKLVGQKTFDQIKSLVTVR